MGSSVPAPQPGDYVRVGRGLVVWRVGSVSDGVAHLAHPRDRRRFRSYPISRLTVVEAPDSDPAPASPPGLDFRRDGAVITSDDRCVRSSDGVAEVVVCWPRPVLTYARDDRPAAVSLRTLTDHEGARWVHLDATEDNRSFGAHLDRQHVLELAAALTALAARM